MPGTQADDLTPPVSPHQHSRQVSLQAKANSLSHPFSPFCTSYCPYVGTLLGDLMSLPSGRHRHSRSHNCAPVTGTWSHPQQSSVRNRSVKSSPLSTELTVTEGTKLPTSHTKKDLVSKKLLYIEISWGRGCLFGVENPEACHIFIES